MCYSAAVAANHQLPSSIEVHESLDMRLRHHMSSPIGLGVPIRCTELGSATLSMVIRMHSPNRRLCSIYFPFITYRALKPGAARHEQNFDTSVRGDLALCIGSTHSTWTASQQLAQ